MMEPSDDDARVRRVPGRLTDLAASEVTSIVAILAAAALVYALAASM